MLTAAKEAGVSRVVVTSSISAITPSPNWPADKVKAEDCWTDIEYCKQKGVSAPILIMYRNALKICVLQNYFFSSVIVVSRLDDKSVAWACSWYDIGSYG